MDESVRFLEEFNQKFNNNSDQEKKIEIDKNFLYNIATELENGDKLTTINGLIKKILEKLNVTYFGGFDFKPDDKTLINNNGIQNKKREFLRDSITYFFENKKRAILVCPEFDYNLADIFKRNRTVSAAAEAGSVSANQKAETSPGYLVNNDNEEEKYGEKNEITINSDKIYAVRTGYKYKGIDMTDFENFEVPYEGPYEEDEDYFGFRENNFDERDFDEKESGGDQKCQISIR